MVLPQQRKRREMFPNTALNSISPDVRMMQAFPNIFFLKEIVGHPTGCATRCKQANNRDSFFFNDTATTEIYTLSLHDALPIGGPFAPQPFAAAIVSDAEQPGRKVPRQM